VPGAFPVEADRLARVDVGDLVSVSRLPPANEIGIPGALHRLCVGDLADDTVRATTSFKRSKALVAPARNVDLCHETMAQDLARLEDDGEVYDGVEKHYEGEIGRFVKIAKESRG